MVNGKTALAGFAMLFLLQSPMIHADVDGRTIAFACSGCHGTDGTLNKPGLPKLKGRSSSEVYQALLDFKSDKVQGTMMNRIAKGFTDKELNAVATFFHQLDIRGGQ